MVARRLLLIAFTALVVCTPTAEAKTRRVEVIDVSGLIDGRGHRSIVGTLDLARREKAVLVVVQINSSGGLEGAKLDDLINRIRASQVPVVTWVGPTGARARHAAALLAQTATVRAMAPGTRLGPVETLDMHQPFGVRATRPARGISKEAINRFFDRGLSAGDSRKERLVQYVSPSIDDLLHRLDGERVTVAGKSRRFDLDPENVTVRFSKLDLFGRVLHAAAQPSITYLLLLLALVGILFEAFHPSTGPAGIAGVLALVLSIYGVMTLGATWFGFGLVVAGVVLFAIDLRNAELGAATVLGFVGLVAGSIALFPGRWLRVSPWVLGFGIVAMVAFLLGAMTRVLRDLRAVERGDLEVRDAHPHPNGQH